MEKWGGMRKKVGEGGEGGGVNEGRKGNQWKEEGGGGGERENPNRKSLHAVHKGECGENKG